MARSPTKTLLFLHIPKAAGTTLSRVVERQVPASRQWRLGANAQASIERYNQLSEKERAHYRLISGHFPYGVHEQVPGPHAYFTLLRDPVDRVASFYYFVRKDPGHYLHQAMSPEQHASLEVFARTTQCPMVDNGQTRQLSGGWGRVPFGECTPEMLERAKENLRAMAVVGLTERFDASLMMLGQRFSWKKLGYRRENQTPGRTAVTEMDASTREALIRINSLDQVLYEFSKKLFEEAWARSGLSDEDFLEKHPPPSKARDILDRIKSRTPREWGKALARRMG